MARTSNLQNGGQERCVPMVRKVEKDAFDVKVVECDLSDAPERWRELIAFLLEVDAAQ